MSDAFDFLERELHEAMVREMLLSRPARSLDITHLERCDVLDLMAAAAAKAREVRKPSAKKAAPKEPEAEDPTPLVLTFPVLNNHQGPFEVHESALPEWRKAFPSVDVLAELHRMKSWLDANGRKRPTRRGMPRFVVTWLSTAQDRASGAASRGAVYGGQGPDNRSGGSATAARARIEEEAAEGRRREELKRRGEEAKGRETPTATVIDGLFGRRGRPT